MQIIRAELRNSQNWQGSGLDSLREEDIVGRGAGGPTGLCEG